MIFESNIKTYESCALGLAIVHLSEAQNMTHNGRWRRGFAEVSWSRGPTDSMPEHPTGIVLVSENTGQAPSAARSAPGRPPLAGPAPGTLPPRGPSPGCAADTLEMARAARASRLTRRTGPSPRIQRLVKFDAGQI
jgi:hypothetical protein